MTHTQPPSALLDLIRRLHFYIGLFVAPFIFIAALTGTLYVLTPQLESWIYAEALEVEPQGEANPLSDQIASAREYAGQSARIYAVRPAPEATDTTRVQFTAPTLGESESRAIFIDPYTLAVKGDMAVYGTSGILPLRTAIDRLHRDLLLGSVGRNYSELAASWLWIAALGGLLLWWTSRPRRKVRQVKGASAKTRHRHVVTGITLSLGLLFFSATGLTWSQWAGSNIDSLRMQLGWLTPQVNVTLAKMPQTAPHAEHAHHSMTGNSATKEGNAPDADWDSVLASARSAGLGAAKLEVRQPKNDRSAWTVTEIDRSWPTRVDAVSIHPDGFTLVDRVKFKDFPLIAKLTRWGVDAHMGVLFGLANQLLLAAFGTGLCALIVFGYRMWWLRRPRMQDSAPSRTLLSAWWRLPRYQKVLSPIAAAALGYALPAMGISLLAFLLVDLARWKMRDEQTSSSLQTP
ncbi:Uncharacterized iron-regulated membrane protein [Leminorella richardii]|uniref:Uncharacterized iron-regulated membrane protein n=1 Tax=Leminorella richardii TaxID=158841 RepID=A0A2X4Y3Z4_9GAMM|nr:Uncharacterized iron-regulated membrane protein [Leminorella richardii]